MPEAPRRRLRRTPCVGVCSTTYGDLVCRGCKRFAHEIVGWNSYADAQRDAVWTRLNALLVQSVRVYLTVVDEGRLKSVARGRVPDVEWLPVEVVAFRTMCARPLPLVALGLAAKASTLSGARSVTATRETIRRIDGEFHARSRAHYEASFKTLT